MESFQDGHKAFLHQDHPLLTDVILKTLVQYISHSDLPNFRKTCRKWKAFIGARFRQEFCINLIGSEGISTSRKIARFIYAMPLQGKSNISSTLPFDSFRISDLSPTKNKNEEALTRKFFDEFLPSMKRLTLSTKSLETVREFLRKLRSIEILELCLSKYNTILSFASRESIFDEDSTLPKPNLSNLKEIKWSSSAVNDEWMSLNFLAEFYSSTRNLEMLTCTQQVGKHLEAIISFGGVHRTLRRFQFRKMGRRDLELLAEFCSEIQEFRCSKFMENVGNLEEFLELHSRSLTVLDLGTYENSENPDEVLQIRLPKMEHLKKLRLELSSKTTFRIRNLPETFPNLAELRLKSNGDSIHFLEDIIEIDPYRTGGTRSGTCWKLELVDISIRNGAETLHGFSQLIPGVRSLTLGRPSKVTLLTLWELIWPELKELRILSASPQIDEVLTGIPNHVSQAILTQRDFDNPNLAQYLQTKSIRDLKFLQRLEINTELGSRSLSCLPSDMSVFFAFMQMKELRSIIILRSLITSEAYLRLRNWVPSWASLKIEQIKFEFDETIEAFQFHRNNQQFLKVLCQYPHQSLRKLPNCFTSLWMSSRGVL